MLLLRQQFAMTSNYLLDWERQVSASAAQLALPLGPRSWSLRLVHLPAQGPEVVWDFSGVFGRSAVTVTRFLESLRERWEQTGRSAESACGVPREISQAELPSREPIVREIEKGIVWGCRQGLEFWLDAAHYFLRFQNSEGSSRAAAITNPHAQPHTESWQRLINRAIGSGLLPPRRFVADYAVAT